MYDAHHKKNPVSFELSPGEWELHIAGRSKGFRIDRFILYSKEHVSDAKAKDSTTPESCSGPSLGELVHHPRIKSYVDRGMLGMALKEAMRASAGDDEAAAEARGVADALSKHARDRRDAIAKVKPAAPVAATGLLVKLARQFSGSERGKELMAEARAWNKEPAVVNAVKAQRIYDQMLVVAKPMRGKGRASDPKIQKRYAYQIRSIQQYVAFLKKKFPNTPACRKAVALAAELGIELSD